ILQTIATKLGETYGLDRCSIYLTGEAHEVRLMATYESPGVRNLIVDLDRYPELKQAFESGQTVFIPDAANDPMLRPVRDRLAERNVRSVIVAPIRWQRATIGAIFLRSERAASPFTDHDVRFCQVIASLTASALRNAYRFEALRRANARIAEQERSNGGATVLTVEERERVAFVALMQRLAAAYANGPAQRAAEARLPNGASEQLDALTKHVLRTVGET
ncbi:MAG: GAF domain-containing protein, partial [Gemmatimonadota bacterium]|nr:GAF domain-containing protein [Gemmatimonadota bacterium]